MNNNKLFKSDDFIIYQEGGSIKSLNMKLSLENKNHKNNCGRPGINGGFIMNPYVKFGVNCYGTKRDPTDLELNMMEAKQKMPFPPTKEEKKFNKLVNKYKKKLDQISLNPFNQEKWHQI